MEAVAPTEKNLAFFFETFPVAFYTALVTFEAVSIPILGHWDNTFLEAELSNTTRPSLDYRKFEGKCAYLLTSIRCRPASLWLDFEYVGLIDQKSEIRRPAFVIGK